jgi:uncharacterized protein YbcV (DUF1398 family)
MSFKTRHLALLMFAKVFFSFDTLVAQETEYFAGKPDKNIKSVLIYEVDIEKDTSYLYRIVEFNKNGQVVKDEQPDYHIHLNYKYDEMGRLIEKDALYGESFANGVTTWFYSESKVIEKNQAMGFYSETVKELDKEGKIVKISTFFVAGGMGESKIQIETFDFNKSKLITKRNIEISYFDFNLEPGETSEMEPETLIEKLKNSKILKKENFTEVYSYNSQEKLTAKAFYIADQKKSLSEQVFEYNDKGLLVKETKKCFENNEFRDLDCIEYSVDRKYSRQNKLESITTKKESFLSIETYKNERLLSSYTKYSDKYESKYLYKYVYFE